MIGCFFLLCFLVRNVLGLFNLEFIRSAKWGLALVFEDIPAAYLISSSHSAENVHSCFELSEIMVYFTFLDLYTTSDYNSCASSKRPHNITQFTEVGVGRDGTHRTSPPGKPNVSDLFQNLSKQLRLLAPVCCFILTTGQNGDVSTMICVHVCVAQRNESNATLRVMWQSGSEELRWESDDEITPNGL